MSLPWLELWFWLNKKKKTSENHLVVNMLWQNYLPSRIQISKSECLKADIFSFLTTENCTLQLKNIKYNYLLAFQGDYMKLPFLDLFFVSLLKFC